MSTVENSLRSQTENSERCPQCGAPVESSSSGALGESTCEACGASLSQPAVDGGNLGNKGVSVPPSPTGGKRNPLALVVVAVVVAAMLYFGFHMARARSVPPPITKSTPAPDFTLAIARRQEHAPVGPARQSGAAEFLGHVVQSVQDRNAVARRIAEPVRTQGPADRRRRDGWMTVRKTSPSSPKIWE